MNTPVNLNRFRKAKNRADKDKRAQDNRVKFGRTKAEKQRDAANEAKRLAKLDGLKRSDRDKQDISLDRRVSENESEDASTEKPQDKSIKSDKDTSL